MNKWDSTNGMTNKGLIVIDKGINRRLYWVGTWEFVLFEKKYTHCWFTNKGWGIMSLQITKITLTSSVKKNLFYYIILYVILGVEIE